jgi:hypothetical protein
MSAPINMTLYRLLVRGGPATEQEAEQAARVEATSLATKGDVDALGAALKTQIAELEGRLAWKVGSLVIGALVALTGIFALIVGWMVTRA